MTDEEIVKAARQILFLRKQCYREIWVNTTAEKNCKELTKKLTAEFERRELELKKQQEKSLW